MPTRNAGRSMLEPLESRRHLSAVIESVTFTGTAANPLVTITGLGFGKRPKATSTSLPLGTGKDFANGSFYFVDQSPHPRAWVSGLPTNLIGLDVKKYSGKRIQYRFGTGLGRLFGTYSFNNGDSFYIGVNGSTAYGTVTLDGSNTIPVTANVTPSVLRNRFPTTVAAGKTLKGSVTVSVANSGNGRSPGPITEGVYVAPLGADVSSPIGLTRVGTATRRTALNPGQQWHPVIGAHGVTIAAGSYELVAFTTLADGTQTARVFSSITIA